MLSNIVVAEICCFIMLFCILMGAFSKASAKDLRNRTFFWMLIFCMLGLVVDALSYVLNPYTTPSALLLTVNIWAYLAGSLQMLPFAYYVYSMQKGLSIWWFNVMIIAVLLNDTYLVYLGVTGQLFSLDPATYGQGSFPIGSEILFFVAMFYYPVLLLLNMKKVGSKPALILASYVIFPFASEMMSALSGSTVSYTLAGCSFSVILIYVLLQNHIINAQANALQLARIDSLTGIANRYIGTTEIKKRLDEKRPFWFVLLDVDKFKTVNDTFGHPTGDELLKTLCQTFKTALPEAFPVRLGGDEFLLLIDGEHSKEVAEARIEHLFEAVRGMHVKGIGPAYKFAISVGASYYNGKNNTVIEALYHTADKLLYVSKQTEGCCFNFECL